MIYSKLNESKALIWRITHRDNLSWILKNGLHCSSSAVRSPRWVAIGNPELIEKRASRLVPLSPYGTLNDYVPFYFTPFSIMLYNIHTGWGGLPSRQNDDIIILVSDLHKIKSLNLPFVFTNKHAYCQWTEYFSDVKDLNRIDWGLLQQRDFKRDPEDPEKIERYQAEALIYQYCPIDALSGVICYSNELQSQLSQLIQKHGLNMPVYARKTWYF